MFKSYSDTDYYAKINGEHVITTPECEFDTVIIGALLLPILPGIILLLTNYNLLKF